MNKPRKPFAFKQFTIHQNGAALPVTTDACLFGALAEFDQPLNILDLGTGTGLLLHMMAQKYPNASLSGIDIHHESLECAKINIQQNNLIHKTNLIKGNFLDPNIIYPISRFDAIISNPPFFENQLKSSNAAKSKSRHFENGEMQQFFNQIDQLLTPNGTAYILLPANNETVEFTPNLLPQKIIFIHNQFNKSAHLKVIELTRKKHLANIEHFFIRNPNNLYSDHFHQIMSPFYLEQALTLNQSLI
jgi:tRNA1Val (adenine37-N6)-methyltransferase